jgi:hypothetical protein
VADEDRIKFCRYCDGVIEWGTKRCPHCGEQLELTTFDDMEFIGQTEVPARFKEGKPKIARPLDEDDSPPVVKPVDPGGPPVMKPIGPAKKKDLPVAKPIGPAKKKAPPVVKPLDGSPPVVKPVAPSKGPPVVKPVAPRKGPPVVKPVGPKKGPPTVKPLAGKPGSPVIQPIEDAPPTVRPVEGDSPDQAAALPADCPICEAEMDPGHVGGKCDYCELEVCLVCTMRANGVKVSTSGATNRKRWAEHLATAGKKVRCPACGQLEISVKE